MGSFESGFTARSNRANHYLCISNSLKNTISVIYFLSFQQTYQLTFNVQATGVVVAFVMLYLNSTHGFNNSLMLYEELFRPFSR